MEQIINKYHNSKIYTIRSFMTNKFYIGSTTQPLYKRLYKHRHSKQQYQDNKFHYITSFDILQYDDNYIELLEDYKCENKNQLEKREGELIRLHRDNCVNIINVGTSIEEKTKNKKQYDKQYHKNHKDIIINKVKQYYKDNKDDIAQKRGEKKLCICGTEYSLRHKMRHIKTQRHINFILEQEAV